MSTHEASTRRKKDKLAGSVASAANGPISTPVEQIPGGVAQRMTMPQHLTSHDVQYLQRTMGNRAVAQLLELRSAQQPQSPPSVMRSSVKVGPANDRYEREANQIAGSLNLPKSAAPVQSSRSAESAPMVGMQGGMAGSDIEGRLRQSKGGGSPLSNGIRRTLEPKLGADLSQVKVHTDKEAAQLSRDLGAQAFTHQNHIYYGAGQSPADIQLTAHEAVHTVQQGAVRTRDDASLARQVDGMGAQEVQMTRDDQGETRSTLSQQTETTASPLPAFSKTPFSGGSDHTPIQRRFGFEIEIPMLFTAKHDFPNVPARATPPEPIPTHALDDVPADAVYETGHETDLYDIPTADAHVNVDHNGSLDQLFRRELEVYANDEGLTQAETNGLKSYTGELAPSNAPIMEVVTDAWDEQALTPVQAQQNFQDVVDWVNARYDDIQGNHQAQVGNYYIGSEDAHSDAFQPRQGYFHATYGVKLSQVPQLFRETTQQKNTLRTYAGAHQTQSKHADNVNRTFTSIGKAKTALKTIKNLWPRTGGGWFKRGAVKSRGTKNWNPGTEAAFLGFLTLLDNYLIMFQNGSTDNLGKNKVGMHYYKSDLFDLAQQLPAEIINTLTNNAGVRNGVIAAIAASVGLAANANLTGPMQGYTLTTYLDQIFRGTGGPLRQDANNNPIHDPLLAGSINPWSPKLGPDQVGPGGNQELGVVMENRHLEYLDPNYGANQDQSDTQQLQDYQQYGPQNVGRTPQQVAMFESSIARLQGPAIRPINEWVPMMMNIYNMLRVLNQ